VQRISSEQPTHLDALTWLRAFAAFFVVISHTLRAIEVPYFSTDQVFSFNVLSVFDMGTFGVLLFFTLSGTTLFVSNVHKGKRFGLIGFYLKRLFRIWPAYVVSLFLYLGFAPLFAYFYLPPQGHWIEAQFLTPLAMSEIFSYLSLSFNITGPSEVINNAYWSLPVEFQYYLLFPLLVLTTRFAGVVGPIVMAALLYGLYRWDLHFFHDSKVLMLGFTFCFGVGLGYLKQQHWLQLRLSSLLGTLGLAILFMLAACLSNQWVALPELPIISNVWICLGMLAVASVLLVLCTNFRMSGWIKRPLMRYGEISYSVYLYHNLLIGIAVCVLIQFEIHSAWGRLFIVLLASTAATYWLAALSYRCVELVSIKQGQRLAKRFR
jgi:peptidoglycan/LPS O-acetylase OafA/YrhL